MARLIHLRATVRRGRIAGDRRWERLAMALLALAALTLCAVGPVPTVRAQEAQPDIAELRKLIAVRDATDAHKPKAVIQAAHAYLKAFPKGHYADEVLLDLARGYVAQKQEKKALQTLDELIKAYPDSPFREHAMAESLPLLAAQHHEKAALARVDALLKAYPNSLQRGRVLLWKANAEYSHGDYAATLAALKQIDPGQDLDDAQQPVFYRLDILALVKSGKGAWEPLQQYLGLHDTPEHKAEVLMLVAEVARKADRPDEALRFYSQVVEDYPVPGEVNEALYWRAEIFATTRLANAPAEVLGARRQTALGYYSAYLSTKDNAHRSEALVARGALERQVGQPQAALADYEQAVQENPKLGADAHLVQARVDLLQALKKRDQAKALLVEASQEPGLTPAQRTSFQVQDAALEYDDKHCDQVMHLLEPMPLVADPALRAKAFFMRGFCRYQNQEWEKATFDLEGLVNDPAYQNLVLTPLLNAYEKSSQYSRLVNMEEELMSAGRVKPSADLLKRLANGYEKLGEPALMLGAYARLGKLQPSALKQPDVQLRMGLAQERLGERKAALASYHAVLGHADPAKSVPADVYFTALEHLQAIDVADGHTQELARLHKAAEAVATDAKSKARLEALRRQLDVVAARAALADGKPGVAAKQLEAVLKSKSLASSQARSEAVALLVVADARLGEGHKLKSLYQAERDRAADADDRAALASAVITEVEASPDALVALPEGSAPKKAAHGKAGQAGKRSKAEARAQAKAEARAAAGRKALVGVFRQALDDLPTDQSQQRYQAAKLLDTAYRQEGDHAARAALVTALLKDGLDAKTQHDLRVYQAQIYRDWGQSLLDKGDLEGARFQLERGLKVAAHADWRLRYELTALLSQVELKRKQYSDVVLLNEAFLPHIEDKTLAGQVRHFLGQVYVEWGHEAETEHNIKSARIRFHYALDYLPASDWKRRLAATHGLAEALQAKGRDADAAEAYAAVIPQIADAGLKRQYALYLGKLFADKLKSPEQASRWLNEADTGGKDALSLEAGYLWADQQIALHHDDAALKRLEALAARGLEGTRWEVPIQYRLAIMLHERKELKAALKHYRIVADVKDPAARKLYPRTIAQSREQVRRIESYLRAGGGQGGVAVPTVRTD